MIKLWYNVKIIGEIKMNLNLIGSISSIVGVVLSVVSIILVSNVYIKINNIDSSNNAKQTTKGDNNIQNIRQK